MLVVDIPKWKSFRTPLDLTPACLRVMSPMNSKGTTFHDLFLNYNYIQEPLTKPELIHLNQADTDSNKNLVTLPTQRLLVSASRQTVVVASQSQGSSSAPFQN